MVVYVPTANSERAISSDALRFKLLKRATSVNCVGMSVSQRKLECPGCAFEEGLGVGRLTEVLEDRGQVAEGDRDVRMIRSVGSLHDNGGAFEEGLGVGRLTEVLEDQCQVAEAEWRR